MSELRFPLLDEHLEKQMNKIVEHENEIIALRCKELGIPLPSAEFCKQNRFNPFIHVTVWWMITEEPEHMKIK